MRTEVIIRTNVPAWAKQLSLKYREMCQEALAEHLDHIREVAAKKYIIPKRADITTNKPGVMARAQPSDLSRLTYRTGALYKMLMEPHKWVNTSSRVLVADGGAIQGRIRVANKGNKIQEDYEANLNLSIKGSTRRFSRRATAQQLIVRFRHDTPGIRGRRRQFYSAAARDENINLSPIIERKLRSIGVI